jgi:hypothetical protein
MEVGKKIENMLFLVSVTFSSFRFDRCQTKAAVVEHQYLKPFRLYLISV